MDDVYGGGAAEGMADASEFPVDDEDIPDTGKCKKILNFISTNRHLKLVFSVFLILILYEFSLQRPKRTLTSWGGPRLRRPETLPPPRGTAEAGASGDVKFCAYQEAIVKTNKEVMQSVDIYHVEVIIAIASDTVIAYKMRSTRTKCKIVTYV